MTPVPVWKKMSIIVGTAVGAATAAVRVLECQSFVWATVTRARLSRVVHLLRQPKVKRWLGADAVFVFVASITRLVQYFLPLHLTRSSLALSLFAVLFLLRPAGGRRPARCSGPTRGGRRRWRRWLCCECTFPSGGKTAS